MLDNYIGIIDLICSPLQPNRASRPLTFADISSSLDEGRKMGKTDKIDQNENRKSSGSTYLVDDIEENGVAIPSEGVRRQKIGSLAMEFNGFVAKQRLPEYNDDVASKSVRQRKIGSVVMEYNDFVSKQRLLRRKTTSGYSNEPNYIMNTNLNC